MLDPSQYLNKIESRHGVVFEPTVRTAVEARIWLTKLGLPFTLDALIRAVLRDGFANGSVFSSFRLRLSMPRRRRRFFSQGAGTTPFSDTISSEVIDCLDLAARIRRGLSMGDKRPCVTRDSVVMAIARLHPDVATRNLVPRDMAERSISAVRAVAARALSGKVGPSRHHLLRSRKEIARYLEARDQLSGWRMTRLSVSPSSIDRNLFVHLSLRDNSHPSGGPDAHDWEIPGRHDELYFYGVSGIQPLMPQEERSPQLQVGHVEHTFDSNGLKHLVLRTRSSLKRNPAPTIVLQYSKELTVAEHSVSCPAFECEADAIPVGLASSA